MNKNIYKSLLLKICACTVIGLSGCSDFLNQSPDQILTDDQIFGDVNMIKSVLANYYGRVHWGQASSDSYSLTILDEATKCDGGPDQRTGFDDNQWRVYDYTLIRNINQFLAGVRATTIISEEEKMRYEGEARFLRAWTYFNMAKGLGGMPLVGDEIFSYEAGMDITTLQFPRSTEQEIYDYIIEECEAIARLNGGSPWVSKQTNGARANKWVALSLKARAALYAASIAKYNNQMETPIYTDGREVGIGADQANKYYEMALQSAEEVMGSGLYALQLTKPDNLSRNFYEALCVKENNVEVIWAKDYYYPGDVVNFTNQNIPGSHKEDIDCDYAGPILNLVEDFEYIDNRNGEIRIKDQNGDYVYYDSPEDAFTNKDPRFSGSILYPGSEFKGIRVEMQAGQAYQDGSAWKFRIAGAAGDKDDNGITITAENGPMANNNQYMNKCGFFFRKFLDETPSASTRGRHSEMWYPRFRYAEIKMIAAEAALELNQTEKALKYLNEVRERAGVQTLQNITFDDIVRENRVEFAFENHRYWDLKRWRLAHKVWNGVNGDPQAQQWGLFPYLVVDPSSPHNGKWIYEKVQIHMSPYPRYFKPQNYYNFIDQSWINNNPKLVKNPFQ